MIGFEYVEQESPSPTNNFYLACLSEVAQESSGCNKTLHVRIKCGSRFEYKSRQKVCWIRNVFEKYQVSSVQQAIISGS